MKFGKESEEITIKGGQRYSEGQLIRKRGKGNKIEGIQGDLYLKVRLVECDEFEFEGLNVWYYLDVPLKEAAKRMKLVDKYGLLGNVPFEKYSQSVKGMDGEVGV